MKRNRASRRAAFPAPLAFAVAVAVALAAPAFLASCAGPAPAIPEGGPFVVLYAEFAQEVNSFSPVLTTERDFRAGALRYGAETAELAAAEKGQIAGFLESVKKVGRGRVEAVPILQATSMSGGPVERAFYESIKARILEALRAAPRVNGVYLSLHGAMGVEGMLDPEGDLLEAVRALVGPGLPVVASFDLHANITARRARDATAIVAYHTNPHRDFFDTGRRSGELLVRAVLGEVDPVMVVTKMALLKGGGINVDFLKPFNRIFRAMDRMEKRDGVLSVSFFPVHIWIDDPELGYSTVAVVDRKRLGAGAETLARSRADKLADMAWAVRAVPQPATWSPEEAVDMARKAGLARALGTVVFCDASDAVGTGTPGESTWILKALLERGADLKSYLTLRDAEAAKAAVAAGVGAEVSLRVGGKLDTVYNRPIDFSGTVVRAGQTRFGATAVVRHEGIHLVLAELPMASNKPSDFSALGLDVWKADIVVVKNLFPFRYNFILQNRKTINVASRGLSSTDPFTLEYRLVPRPIYPLDEVADWRRAGD
ncbi:MAG: M81 family metallopeptidase [Spirochaetales bacterium]|nr:M81 family metallopeptidase [Spirochaetales bacterium]